MPRTPARDTPAQRETSVQRTVAAKLDFLADLDPDSVARVIDWLDGLVDGKPDTVTAELSVMRSIAGLFETLGQPGRERIVRWVNDLYGAAPDADANVNDPDYASTIAGPATT